MPTYNGAAHVAAALESVAAQAEADLEVVAVDDGSTDGTLDVLRGFRARLPLRIVERPHGGNWVASTNQGLALARGRHLGILHQDDRWLPGRLAVLGPLLSGAPAAAWILHPCWFVDEAGRRAGLWRCPLPAAAGGAPPELVVERLLVQNFVAMPAPIFTRAALDRVGPMDETLWYSADWEFWLRLAAAGPTLHCPMPLAEFRVHALSQSIRRSAHANDFRRQLETVLERHLAAWPATGRRRRAVERAARLSVEVNVRLAARAHGGRAGWPSLLGRFLALGPAGWRRYWRDSRLGERVAARLRAGALPRPWAAGEPGRP
jgi:glycosyltransferase involved in cell wall biosynthesis